MTRRLGRIASVLFAVPIAVGCMRPVTGTSSELVAARTVYAQAAASSAKRDAQPALVEARRTLDAAERAHELDPASPRERHLAQLAKRRAELAMVMASRVAAERDAQQRKDELREAGEIAAHAAEEAREQAEIAQQQLQTAQQQANIALEQLQQARDERAAAQLDATSSREELDRLENELADTRRQLAARGSLADAQTRALRDREIALQAQIDLLRIERDRIEAERVRLQQERDRALEGVREFATINENDDRGLVITVPGEVIFRTGSARLLPRARAKLDELATALGELGTDQQFVIEGHTDSRGSAAYNAKLSKRRAHAVRAYLIDQGVDADRIVARGRGEEEPVASNALPEGRAENRRVEIVVSPPVAASR